MEGFAPRFDLLHNHDRRDAVPESFAFTLQLDEPAPGLPDVLGSVLVEKAKPHLVGLCLGPFLRSEFGNLADGFFGPDDSRLARSQRCFVDTDVVDVPLETRPRKAAGADPQGLILLNAVLDTVE